MKKNNHSILLSCCLIILLCICVPLQAEVILQFFNNTWEEITQEIPEIAEVGYSALWLPPPQKAGSVYSVGYDLWDPFDLGNKDQQGTVKTRYGTENELLRLIEVAHRHGIRVYFDNIMNHRAFSIPGYNEDTAIDIYPGMLPEDFHLRVTEEGFYRAWNDTENWGNTWQVQNQFLSGLIDIAHETPNSNFGANEGDTHPKISFVRHPNNPEYYDYHPTLGHVGFASTAITTNIIADNESFFMEDVGSYLMRSIRWLVDRTKVDGLRLDAVKHVPGYFFGDQSSGDKDTSSAGYCGQAQWQFNQSRGYSDDNHRDTLFDIDGTFGRNDLMIFGEHMGEPPPYSDYWDSGMRLLDARLHQTLNDNLGNPSASMSDYQWEGGGGFAYNMGVTYAKSHDDNIANRPELHYALALCRRGLPDIYTDGNRQAETLGQSGGAFPRHANTAYLGQWGDNRIPNLVYIHNQFARGWQYARWGDDDVAAFDRIDKRENFDMDDGDGVVLSFMMNDNYDDGAYREIPTAFPDGSYLWQYSTAGGGFYHTVSDGKIKVIIPPGGYFCFSWRNPEESDLWSHAGGKPITIYQNGEETPWVSYWRYDGPDGDENFNPYGVSETEAFGYKWSVPRITDGSNITFTIRADGSANNALVKLDGGIGINSTSHSSGDPRDYPPGNEGSTEVYEGYEQADFSSRINQEKFADNDTSKNKIGSAGSGSYEFTVGSSGISINDGSGENDYDGTYGAKFVYHNPDGDNGLGENQFWPYPIPTADTDIWVQAKVGNAGQVNRVFFYYTTDGTSWPEGAGGQPQGNTQVQEMFWHANVTEGSETNDWWRCHIPGGFPAGTVVRYKIGAFQLQGSDGIPWATVFPGSDSDVSQKKKMMGTWKLENINTHTLSYRPHNDWGITATGLKEGFHVLSARAFLQRDGSGVGNGNRASIYNTFTQPFYLDTKVPGGIIQYPAENDTLYDNEYGVVVRADETVTKVYYHIEDADSTNDDGATGLTLGNGTNDLGEWSWVEASESVPPANDTNQYMREFRFNYSNIPDGGDNAQIYVKLAEVSSSTNPVESASTGHFAELIRNVKTDGPGYKMFVAWPQNDGDLVGPGYGMKVYFSQSLADGINETTLRNRFLIKVDGQAQPKDDYVINYSDIDGQYYSLEFELGDYYTDTPPNLHDIDIIHTNAGGGGITLTAARVVEAVQTSSGPTVQITSPPAVDESGIRFDIILPDIPNPSPTDRQYNITVKTSTNVLDTWLVFTNSTGYTTPVPATTNALSNPVSVMINNSMIFGSGFESEVTAGSKLLIEGNLMTVSVVNSDTNLSLTALYPGSTASGVTAYAIQGNPTLEGSSLYWNYIWTNITEGTYHFYAFADTDGDTNTIEASTLRSTIVIFREMVNSVTNDFDDDDDGLYDTWETTSTNLPSTNPETWTNDEVARWYAYGQTIPLYPDTDGDGLPDGLELGIRVPSDHTDEATDTNGDGAPNFIADLDPPIYNTVPDNWDLPNYNFNASRTDQIQGSVTDPNSADSDSDGIKDGIEDWNKNGWVDGDGESMPADWDPWPERDWPDGEWDTSWTETDPNNSDTDGDGATDGNGEDMDGDGWIAGDINSNRTWNAGELWTETDPLNPDTDGDTLPDGWETQYGLSPFDNGIIGHTNMQTGALITDIINGPDGNPDGDYIAVGASSNEYTNIQEFENGTNPQSYDSIEPPPTGSVVIGRGEAIGELTGTDTHYQEFTDWTLDDCLVLDQYEGIGGNNEGGDIYMAWDEWDSSRDLVAFYARDGGAAVDKFYYRVDLHDLAAYAEDANLNVYVVIDTGNPNVGEMALPDEVDCVTSMKWEAVVAVYSGGSGKLYVDTDRANNTTESYQDLSSYGVVGRDQSDPMGYIGAHFSSDLDSVEFAVSRQGLTDAAQGAGWNGLDPGDLNYQVFTVKDDTCNGCVGGEAGGGDLGGRPDIRDAFYNDYIAEDYWDSQQGLPHVLMYWFDGNTRANAAKFSVIIHGAQTDLPGSTIQDKINTGEGGGYHRPLGAHDLYDLPLNLHITPTLAMAMEWAKVDPATPDTWRLTQFANGPLFNEWIKELVATNVVNLLASTYADHILPYYTDEYNSSNIDLANTVLSNIYGFVPTASSVFWAPERVLDSGSLSKIANAGYNYTVIDQTTHVWNWFGRQSSLGRDGYRINKIENVDCFVINDGVSDVRFDNHDGGIPMNLRNLLIRKALDDDTPDQMVTLFSGWEDFMDFDKATAYDKNIRWIANHPWIQPVGFNQIAEDRNFGGYQWWSIERGTGLNLSKQSHNWMNHATRGDYDSWYLGDNYEEGLLEKKFDIRPGVPMATRYGMLYFTGVISSAWEQVESIVNPYVSTLAESAIHASSFETAFHNEGEHDLSRWSTGDYIYPAVNESNTLAGFSKAAQAQSRTAAIYKRVDQWAQNDVALTTTQTDSDDLDLDGEDEYILYNDRMLAIFERIGGRMIGTWVRDILGGGIYQVIGNQTGYAGSETEEEGVSNCDTNGVVLSYRTSALKDWNAGGSTAYVNQLYTFTPVANGWQISSQDGAIVKTIKLQPAEWEFEVQYSVGGALAGQNLYFRHGLSPHLWDLLVNGQATLADATTSGGVYQLVNNSSDASIIASIGYADSGHGATLNTAAVDDDPSNGVTFHTINMRNQAQTEQVEFYGTGTFSHSLGFQALPADNDNDGMPTSWEIEHGLNITTNDAALDADGDGFSNFSEYIANTDPNDPTDFLYAVMNSFSDDGSPIPVKFPAKPLRNYTIDYRNDSLLENTWVPAVLDPIQVLTEQVYTWDDDGTATTPNPSAITSRFYRIKVSLPE